MVPIGRARARAAGGSPIKTRGQAHGSLETTSKRSSDTKRTRCSSAEHVWYVCRKKISFRLHRLGFGFIESTCEGFDAGFAVALRRNSHTRHCATQTTDLSCMDHLNKQIVIGVAGQVEAHES